jgi:hypothetical protein
MEKWRPRGLIRHRWQGDIKTERQEIMEGVKLIDLAGNRHKRLSVVKNGNEPSGCIKF